MEEHEEDENEEDGEALLGQLVILVIILLIHGVLAHLETQCHEMVIAGACVE